MKPARQAPFGRAFSILAFLGLGLLALPDRLAVAAQSIYDRLNGGDLALARSVLQETLETQRSEEIRLWRNDATGNSGSVMPLRTFKIKTGHFCRDYRETVLAGRTMASRTGTACRSGNGLWVSIER